MYSVVVSYNSIAATQPDTPGHPPPGHPHHGHEVEAVCDRCGQQVSHYPIAVTNDAARVTWWMINHRSKCPALAAVEAGLLESVPDDAATDGQHASSQQLEQALSEVLREIEEGYARDYHHVVSKERIAGWKALLV